MVRSVDRRLWVHDSESNAHTSVASRRRRARASARQQASTRRTNRPLSGGGLAVWRAGLAWGGRTHTPKGLTLGLRRSIAAAHASDGGRLRGFAAAVPSSPLLIHLLVDTIAASRVLFVGVRLTVPPHAPNRGTNIEGDRPSDQNPNPHISQPGAEQQSSGSRRPQPRSVSLVDVRVKAAAASVASGPRALRVLPLRPRRLPCVGLHSER